ncbi:hypothetical protein Aduo_018816 [Ancylostoma duodenale]
MNPRAVQSERERSDPLHDIDDGDDDYRENSPDRCSVKGRTDQYSMKADALPSPDAELNRAILISALASSADSFELCKGLYKLSLAKRMKIWHRHFVDAAQFMGAEMVLAGYKFCYPEHCPFAVVEPVVIVKGKIEE